MNKEKLVKMGLTEEQAQKVMGALDGSYVTKARFNEVNEENKGLKEQIADGDGQLEALKKSSGDNEALKTQIAQLQKANSDAKDEYEKQIAQMKFDNALEKALSFAKAKNTKAVKALLDVDKLTLNGEEIDGLKEGLEAVKTENPYLFEDAPSLALGGGSAPLPKDFGFNFTGVRPKTTN